MIFLVVKLLVGVFILLLNVKMPTIVDSLTFMSRISFVLSCVQHEKKSITLGPGAIRHSSFFIHIIHGGPENYVMGVLTTLFFFQSYSHQRFSHRVVQPPSRCNWTNQLLLEGGPYQYF